MDKMNTNAGITSNEINEPLFYQFGELTEEQKGRSRATKIVRCESALAPAEIQKFLTEWRGRAKTYTFKGLCVRGESIIFGYGDRLYKINGSTLNMDSGDFEEMAPDLLKSLQEFGCNYGIYLGYLD